VASKAVFGHGRKSRSAKENINIWLVIHYLDFDSVTPYDVCSPQLKIVN